MSNVIGKCPGTDTSLKVTPEIFTCPDCGKEMEIWTDENKGRCSFCNKKFSREQLQDKS